MQTHPSCKAVVPKSFSKGMCVRRVHLGLKFPSNGLRQGAQGKLGAGQQRKLGPATHACSCPCEEDGAVPGFHHGWKRLHVAGTLMLCRGQQCASSMLMRAADTALWEHRALHSFHLISED